MVALFGLNAEGVELVDDVHLHFAVGVAVEGVVDLLAEHLVVQRVIQRQREHLVEDLQDLHLEVRWVDGGEGLVQHVLQVLQVALVEGLQPPYLHAVLDEREVFDAGRNGHFPAEEASAEGKLLVVGEWVG